MTKWISEMSKVANVDETPVNTLNGSNDLACFGMLQIEWSCIRIAVTSDRVVHVGEEVRDD